MHCEGWYCLGNVALQPKKLKWAQFAPCKVKYLHFGLSADALPLALLGGCCLTSAATSAGSQLTATHRLSLPPPQNKEATSDFVHVPDAGIGSLHPFSPWGVGFIIPT